MKKVTQKPILRIVPALAARTQLGQILRRVRQNRERFVVGRRGEPQAVIMNIEEYLKHFARESPTLERIRRQAKSKKLDLIPLRTINMETRLYRRSRRRND